MRLRLLPGQHRSDRGHPDGRSVHGALLRPVPLRLDDRRGRARLRGSPGAGHDGRRGDDPAGGAPPVGPGRPRRAGREEPLHRPPRPGLPPGPRCEFLPPGRELDARLPARQQGPQALRDSVQRLRGIPARELKRDGQAHSHPSAEGRALRDHREHARI